MNQGWELSCSNECQRACPHSHVDVVSVHDAAQVFIGGKDSVETVVIDVSYNHLTKEIRGLLNTYENWASLFLSMSYRPDYSDYKAHQIIRCIKNLLPALPDHAF